MHCNGIKRHALHLKRKHRTYNYDKISQESEQANKERTKLCRAISKGTRDTYLYDFGFYDELLIEPEIIIPEDFRFIENYSIVNKFLKIIYSSLRSDLNEIIISFKYCDNISLPSVLILKSLIEGFRTEFRRLYSGKYGGLIVQPTIKFEPSKSRYVNQLLNAADFHKMGISETDPLMKPKLRFPFRHGAANRISYTENTKSKISDEMLRFLAESLGRKGVGLTYTSSNKLSRMIGEILTNAEDHSIGKDWYVMGTLHEDGHGGTDDIGVFDFAILNYGDSISKGIEKTSDSNSAQVAQLESLYSTILKINPKEKRERFNKSNLFTLFALQEGVSRLKYLSESRGTGTVNFINAFMYLGSYVDVKNNHDPSLIIVSGDTMIKCDNEFKPFEREGATVLTLNKEQDLRVLPSDRHLKKLRTSFPGTLLSVRIYLSSKHFEQILKENESRGN